MSAMLTAMKKQQAFADWRFVERHDNIAVVDFVAVHNPSNSRSDCELRFQRQLDDEQIRERLETDFRDVRNKLVDLALSPILRA